MDSLKSLDFSSFIIFSDDPWSFLVSFRQLFKLPLVVLFNVATSFVNGPLLYLDLLTFA